MLGRMFGFYYLSIVMMKRADLEEVCLQLASEHSELNAVTGGNQVWRRDAVLIQCPPKESQYEDPRKVESVQGFSFVGSNPRARRNAGPLGFPLWQANAAPGGKSNLA
jgi:hypothetical protein